MSKTVVQEVAEEIGGRIDRGEPEPGTFVCGRCRRTDGVQMFAYRAPHGNGPVVKGYDWSKASADAPFSIEARLMCPCCSFTACPHRGLVTVSA